MQSLTREEYDHMTREGLTMPKSFMLVEANGVHTCVVMTSGAAAAVENPRMKDPNVRVAVTNLADLVEFYHVGVTDRPVDTPFSDFMYGPDALKLENADVLEAHIRKSLLHVETWLLTRPTKDWESADLVPMAKEYVRVLREAKF
jgi:hypothetical protein